MEGKSHDKSTTSGEKSQDMQNAVEWCCKVYPKQCCAIESDDPCDKHTDTRQCCDKTTDKVRNFCCLRAEMPQCCTPSHRADYKYCCKIKKSKCCWEPESTCKIHKNSSTKCCNIPEGFDKECCLKTSNYSCCCRPCCTAETKECCRTKHCTKHNQKSTECCDFEDNPQPCCNSPKGGFVITCCSANQGLITLQDCINQSNVQGSTQLSPNICDRHEHNHKLNIKP